MRDVYRRRRSLRANAGNLFHQIRVICCFAITHSTPLLVLSNITIYIYLILYFHLITFLRSVSLRAKFCHEQALRIVLHCISLHAARHSKYIEPLISLSIDFYVRIFVR